MIRDKNFRLHDMAISTQFFKDKSVLITGGTGSFGQAFAKKLLTEDLCKKVVIFSRDEWKQWEMKQASPIFNHPKIRYFLGDVRDLSRLTLAFNEIDAVIHAAALKQVPAAEYNPTEFIKTNILGAMNVMDAAIYCGVKKVIALSTDKAANPINLYGATKLCSDKLFIAGSSYVGAKGYPTFAVVRYGNVAGSRGSIIPLFRKLLKEKVAALPITDPRMTRFWITLDQSVDFVIKCTEISESGEIFVPKIPSVKVIDIVEALAPGYPHEVIGIREGEKVDELMVGADDARHTLEYDDHFVIYPESYFHTPVLYERYIAHQKGKKIQEPFTYSSANNREWLTGKALQDAIASI